MPIAAPKYNHDPLTVLIWVVNLGLQSMLYAPCHHCPKRRVPIECKQATKGVHQGYHAIDSLIRDVNWVIVELHTSWGHHLRRRVPLMVMQGPNMRCLRGIFSWESVASSLATNSVLLSVQYASSFLESL